MTSSNQKTLGKLSDLPGYCSVAHREPLPGLPVTWGNSKSLGGWLLWLTNTGWSQSWGAWGVWVQADGGGDGKKQGGTVGPITPFSHSE